MEKLGDFIGKYFLTIVIVFGVFIFIIPKYFDKTFSCFFGEKIIYVR